MPAPTTPDNQQPTNTPGTAPGSNAPDDHANDEPGDELDEHANDEPGTPSANAGAANGAGKPKKSKKPEGVTAEIQAYLDAELAKARRSATEAGKQKGREEYQAELDDRNADDSQRLAKANTKITTLEAENVQLKNDHARLLMALKVGLPKPEVNFKRLIVTDDEEALEADAIELRDSLGVVQPNGNNRQPPVTPRGPSGGRSNQQPTRSDDGNAQAQKIGAQAADPMYRSL